MAAFRSRRSFSYLYLANVIGAALGTLLSTFVLIELLGFRKTLHLTAAFNVAIGLAALTVSGRASATATANIEAPASRKVQPFEDLSEHGALALLFLTGFCGDGGRGDLDPAVHAVPLAPSFTRLPRF